MVQPNADYNMNSYEIDGLLIWREEFDVVIEDYPRRTPMKNVCLTLVAGDNRSFSVFVKDSDGNPINALDATAVMTLKKYSNSVTASIIKTGVVGSADEGEFVFAFLPADSANKADQYYFDVRLTLPNAKRYTVLYGSFNIINPIGA